MARRKKAISFRISDGIQRANAARTPGSRQAEIERLRQVLAGRFFAHEPLRLAAATASEPVQSPRPVVVIPFVINRTPPHAAMGMFHKRPKHRRGLGLI